MNFLAHAHLSANTENLLLGNMIADAVKGKVFYNFPFGVQQGILEHRKIDTFTDNHPRVLHSKQLVKETLGRYSGVAVDIYYDHFLAARWNDFSLIDLADFTTDVYQLLGNSWAILPARTRRMFPYMVAQNWLNSYANPNELERVFYGMDRRTAHKSGLRIAMTPLMKNYDALQDDFLDFYPHLQEYVNDERENIQDSIPSSAMLLTRLMPSEKMKGTIVSRSD